jgi:hypothetical protein
MMNRLLVVRNRQGRFFVRRGFIGVCALWLSASVAALAQGTAPALKANQPFSIRAIHLVGLPNTKSNCKGTLSTQDNILRFQQSGKTVAQVDITSVRDVFLGEEEMQVGGMPMKIGKAAAPYGGGRLVSLFAHKTYDTLTLEYVAGDGGVHGALFQIDKGQGELVRNELLARGVSSSSGENQATKQSSSEVTHDNK